MGETLWLVHVAVVSDIHGNRQAFEAVLGQIMQSSCEELWCLGDLVGYGADPDACVAIAQEHATICLAGNHDLVVTGALPLEEFSRGAAVAARWTQQVITEETREYLEQLQPVWLDEETTGLFHASPRDPVWEYVLSPLQADLCLDVQEHRVCLIGHSHVALSFSRKRSAATGQTRHDGEELDLAEGEWLVNPGSVGQPRDGDPRAAWLELDTETWRAVFRRTEYDIAGAAAAIQAARLPTSLAERLAYGQ